MAMFKDNSLKRSAFGAMGRKKRENFEVTSRRAAW